jgi:hypothetical protein
MIKNTEEIMAIRLAEVERLVNEFREILEKGFADAGNTISINEIEELWTKLRLGTDEVYTNLVSDYMAALDEHEIIEQKKKNIEGRI